jgi:hypothetical protein
MEDTLHQTRPKIDAGDASLLTGGIHKTRLNSLANKKNSTSEVRRLPGVYVCVLGPSLLAVLIYWTFMVENRGIFGVQG